jgi:hypothetical protein
MNTNMNRYMFMRMNMAMLIYKLQIKLQQGIDYMPIKAIDSSILMLSLMEKSAIEDRKIFFTFEELRSALLKATGQKIGNKELIVTIFKLENDRKLVRVQIANREVYYLSSLIDCFKENRGKS